MRWRLRVLSVLFLSCVSGQAQRVSFGVKGGLTGMNGFSGSYYTRSEARAHTFGPMVEFKLPASLAIEFDVLYRRTGYTKGGESFGLNTITQMRANTWDFPVLLKYYGSRGKIRPYAAGGWVFRAFSGAGGTRHDFGLSPYTLTSVDTTSPVAGREMFARNTAGPAAGAGLRFRAGRLNLAPEIRYTRWLKRSLYEYGSRSYSLLSSQNQIDFLLGLSF